MKRSSLICVGSILILFWSSQAPAEDRITAFVNAHGKVVFTNTNLGRLRLSSSKINPELSNQSSQAFNVGSLDGLIDSISKRNGVDPSLVRAVIKVESNFDRRAVSHKGALGLMQLIPSTGKRFGVRDFFDPAQNIDGGVRYLRFLLQKFHGNLDLSLAAYNSGENRVERLGRIPRIPETQDYVRKVRSRYRQMAEDKVDLIPGTTIYHSVDGQGVKHFYNVPPNQKK